MYKVIKNCDKIDKVIGIYETRDEANRQFIKTAMCTVPNYYEYDYEDLDRIERKRYVNFKGGTVYIEEDGKIPKGAKPKV